MPVTPNANHGRKEESRAVIKIQYTHVVQTPHANAACDFAVKEAVFGKNSGI